MNDQNLYVAAYDISDSKRMRRAFAILLDYAIGRQKSVFECVLTNSQRNVLLGELTQTLCDEDAFFLVPVLEHPNISIGIAEAPNPCGDIYIE